jgi:nicotinamidase/pyrazinamidase
MTTSNGSPNYLNSTTITDMNTHNLLFWDVDTQVDFLHPGGRLYVSGAEKIIPNLQRLTAWADSHGVSIVASACAHQPGDPELQTYGPHCMAGTPGQKKVPETLLPSRYVVPNKQVNLPELKSFQQTIIEKQAFDVFSNPNSVRVVQQFGNNLRIVMYGLVTEICVACAANSLLDRGHHVELVGDAIAALDAQTAAAFLEAFVDRGGRVVEASDILKKTTAA